MHVLQNQVKALMPEMDGVQPTIFMAMPTDDGGWCVKPVPGQIIADATSAEAAYVIAACMNKVLSESSYREALEAIREAARRELRVAGDPLRAIEQTASNALVGADLSCFRIRPSLGPDYPARRNNGENHQVRTEAEKGGGMDSR